MSRSTGPGRRPGSSRSPRPSPASSRSSREAARLAAEQQARRARERKILIAFVLAVAVLVVGGGIGLQAWRTKRAPTASAPVVAVSDAPQTLEPGQPLRFGRADAPVLLALYEDFHCPHCADLEEELEPTLLRAQQAGRLRVEFHPLSFVDAGSISAANAVGCAAEAGFGQRYQQGLFANPTLEWNDEQLLALAGLVGGQADESFSTCVTTRAQAAWADSIDAAADRAGVTGTPTLFLNGAPVPAADLTAEALQAMIDSAVPSPAK